MPARTVLEGPPMSSTAAPSPRLFADRSVRTKVLSALGALALVTVGVSAGSLVALQQGSEHSEELYQDSVVGLTALGRVHQEELKTRMLVAQHAATPDAEGKAKVAQKIADSDAELDTWAAKYSATGPADAADWKTFTDTWAQWRQARDTQLVPRSDAGDLAGWASTERRRHPAAGQRGRGLPRPHRGRRGRRGQGQRGRDPVLRGAPPAPSSSAPCWWAWPWPPPSGWPSSAPSSGRCARCPPRWRRWPPGT